MDKKVLILLPIWKRETIARIVFDNLKALQKDYNIEVLCIVSEDWASSAATEYGFKQVYASNDCIGTKMNIGVEEALKYDFDYMMNLGDDDIITPQLFKSLAPFFKAKKVMFGITRVTFIDTKTKRVRQTDYGLLIGAGRCIRKDILKKCVVKDGVVSMYDKIQNGLDMNSLRRFDKYSHTEIEVPFGCIYDLKSETNIWPFDELPGKIVKFDVGTTTLTKDQRKRILAL